MAAVLIALLGLGAMGSTATMPADTWGDRIAIQADQVRVDPNTDQIAAMGRTRLRIGSLTIDAAFVRLDLRDNIAVLNTPDIRGHDNATITAQRLILNFKDQTFHLDKPRFDVVAMGSTPFIFEAASAVCDPDGCILFSTQGTLCAHRPSGYELQADRVVIHPSGDLDLYRPTLMMDNLAIARLPWIRLRPTGAAGFLAPRLAWGPTSGLILGPAGYIPMGQSSHLEGYFAGRIPHGYESESRLVTPHLDIALNHLYEEGAHDWRLCATAGVGGAHASLVADVDAVTQKRIIDALTFHPLDRILTHTSSRVRASAQHSAFLLESTAVFHRVFLPTAGPVGNAAWVPTAAVGITLPSSPLLPRIWPNVSLWFDRLGPSVSSAVRDAQGNRLRGQNRLSLAYGMDIPGRIGPVAATVQMAGRHQIWLPEQAPVSSSVQHIASGAAYLSLPLSRRYTALLHRISPYVRYRLTPVCRGSPVITVVDDADVLRCGHGIEVGGATLLARLSGTASLRVDVRDRIDLPGIRGKGGPAYLAASATVNWGNATLSGDGAVDHRTGALSEGGVLVRLHPEAGNALALGARWLGAGRGPHRDHPFAATTGPWIVGRWTPYLGEYLAGFADLTLSPTRRIKAVAGLRTGLWPTPALHALWYGFEISSACGCARIGIRAAHRFSQAIPDVMATLRLFGL
ncbi:MAG: hypothetical protein QNJ97_10860 [Myxococcota bacterium]|nr:hypothetical protein [Myxococcota bacterium]